MLYSCTGVRFANEFVITIQIWWKLCLAVLLLLAIRLQQIFVHARTEHLSCHAQIFLVITVPELRWEWSKFSIEFELEWKKTVKQGLGHDVLPKCMSDCHPKSAVITAKHH